MKILYTLLLLMIGYSSLAQERQLISTTGFSHQSEYNFSTSIGEPIIGILVGTNTTFSQGFTPMKIQTTASNMNNTESSISIVPNPVSTHIYVKGVNLDQGFTYCIVGANGDIIEQNKLTDHRINTSFLAPGNYILTIFNNETTFKQKVIKQ
ncbi:T9SS type A sorting domain-containing protein [Carboxylicivirga taeanensis]|uniref:T9SS type A sorting domain-containing protein n=1 Tax=Carboxylicivirga taeanensis TaxID=1416875 RepID=UPI003F6E3E61